MVFVQPYSRTIGRTYFPKAYPWDENVYAGSHYLKEAVRGGPLEANVLCHDAYNAHLIFYLNTLNEQGKQMKSVSKHVLEPGMKAMATEQNVKECIERDHEHRIIFEKGALRISEIIGIHEATS